MNNFSLDKFSRRTTLFFAFLSLLLLSGLANAQTGNDRADRQMRQWRFFEPEAAGFRVSLPAQPVGAVIPFETPTSTLDLYVFASRTVSSTYAISYVDLDISPKDVKALEIGFERARSEILSKVANTNLISEKKLTSGKFPGREFVFESGVNVYKTQMFRVKQRVYVVQLVTPQTRNLPDALVKVYQAESDKFFNSFQILEAKKAEPVVKAKTKK